MKVEDKIDNIEILIYEMTLFPHTYNTILYEFYKNGTLQFKLRRKLCKLLKYDIIRKSIIPGTRFGMVIYYIKDKKYIILIEKLRYGVNVYYFFTYKIVNKFFIELKHYWILKNNVWEFSNEKKLIGEDNVLKII